MDRNDLAG